MKNGSYKPKNFNLSGLNGISDRTLEMHFKLYEGYVKATNELNKKISDLLTKKGVDHEKVPDYSELKRRLGFEYNGMVLHEYYFENLEAGGGSSLKPDIIFYKMAQAGFGSFEMWKEDFISTGKMRGVGWVICYQDPISGRLSNHWITLHEGGNIAGYQPLLVMDMWEHAFLLDYKPSDKEKYIEAFFSNIDWRSVENRLT